MRSSLRSLKRREERKKRTLRLVLASFLALVSVGSAVVFFFESRFFRVSDVSIVGGNAAMDGDVRSIVDKSISGNRLWLIPNDSSFFFPSKGLSQSIPAEFPAIASVSFSRQGLTSIVARIHERLPYAIACVSQGGDACYYFDENGFIFEPASSTDSAFAVYRISLPLGTDPIGIDFIDKGRLDALRAFVNDLSKLGFKDDGIAVSTSSDYDLTLEHEEGDLALSQTDPMLSASSSADASSSTLPIMHLYINENRPLPETFADFSAFWLEYTSKATSTEALDVSSIDMRYGNNIIYKTR